MELEPEPEPEPCELCKDHPALYCASDSAFLCLSCDAKVHSANFLVARHLRTPLCSKCKAFSLYSSFSGPQFTDLSPLCPSCSPSSSSTSTSNSTCVSTATSSSCSAAELDLNKTPPRCAKESKVRRLLEIWCHKLGLGDRTKAMVSIAVQASSLCMGRLGRLPRRVTLAASLWLGLRYGGETAVAALPKLRLLEELSGASAEVIVVTHRKLCILLRERRRHSKECWAECSV